MTVVDNVHFQNSAQFIKALVEKDVFFRLQVRGTTQDGCILLSQIGLWMFSGLKISWNNACKIKNFRYNAEPILKYDYYKETSQKCFDFWNNLLQVYTDQQHGLNGGNTKKHLYESMEDFLGECFEGVSKKFEMKQKEHEKTQKQEPVEWDTVVNQSYYPRESFMQNQPISPFSYWRLLIKSHFWLVIIWFTKRSRFPKQFLLLLGNMTSTQVLKKVKIIECIVCELIWIKQGFSVHTSFSWEEKTKRHQTRYPW